MSEKILTRHTERKALVYVRQSSPRQVRHNNESRRLQYALKQRVIDLGWTEVEIIDDDLRRSGASTTERVGFGGRWVPRRVLNESQVLVGGRAYSPFLRAWRALRSQQSVLDYSMTDLYRDAERQVSPKSA